MMIGESMSGIGQVGRCIFVEDASCKTAWSATHRITATDGTVHTAIEASRSRTGDRVKSHSPYHVFWCCAKADLVRHAPSDPLFAGRALISEATGRNWIRRSSSALIVTSKNYLRDIMAPDIRSFFGGSSSSQNTLSSTPSQSQLQPKVRRSSFRI